MGYYGAPANNIGEVEEIFQPLPFTEKRFPNGSYLTPAYKATLPATLATINEITYGVVVDASEYPFNPLPIGVSRSPFGVAIRDKDGKVRPMAWAPIMGNDDSKITSGTEFIFNYRLYLSKRNLSDAYEDIARRLYGFSDYRHNDLGSLNSAFENLLSFAMSPYGRYIADMKGYSYETDVPNSVKNTSSILIYSVAYVVDDSLIFKHRAIPITEFMLSRENFLYAKQEHSGAGQTAKNLLGDPCMNTTEMAAYYKLSEKQSTTFSDLAFKNLLNFSNLAHERSLRENIAMYEATDEVDYLTKVIDGTDKYIDERIHEKQTGFNYIDHSSSSFWSSLAPKFWELYESYKLTGYERYLEAAHVAARTYAYHLWMSPAIPDEKVTCNINNKAPLYRSGIPISIPQEDAPAWRLSSIGLSCEAGATSSGNHRAVFMANHAPYFMRIGALTNDQFLMDIAKAAIIGRWRSFPGYHINTDRTTVYEKADFACRSISELLTTTSMHYSHVWPMIALTFDYLVSDVFAKSLGEIDFPSVFTENTAYLYNNLYFKSGTFYDDGNVILWMPVGLIKCDNQELNYIVARGNNKLYMAFVNQSNTAVDANITINSDILNFNGNNGILWSDNVKNGSTTVNNNEFNITVSAKGISAIEIDNVLIDPKFQEKISMHSNKYDWVKAYEKMPEVDARAMILEFSKDYTRIYAYSDALEGKYQNVRFKLYYDNIVHDDSLMTTYPFEFGQWIPKNVNFVKLVVTVNNSISKEVNFTRNPNFISASVSGWTSVLKGDAVHITYEIDGKPPWQLSYTDGKSTFEKEINAQIFSESVSPDTTTTYQLLSAIDTDGEKAFISDMRVKVSIIDGYVLNERLVAKQDAYIDNYTATINYGTDMSLEVCGLETRQKEIYIEFDLANADKNGNIYLLGLWLNDMIDSTSVIEVLGNDIEWSETNITWENKPMPRLFEVIDTIGISRYSPEGSYHYFNVTKFFKESSSNKITFKIKFLKGGKNMLLNFASKDADNDSIAPCIVSDVILGEKSNNMEGRINSSDVKISIANRNLLVNSEHPVLSIKIYNIAGQIIGSYFNKNVCSLTGFKSGIYAVVIETDSNSIVKKFYY